MILKVSQNIFYDGPVNLYRNLVCQDYQSVNSQILSFVQDKGIDHSQVFWNPVDTKIFLQACPLFLTWTMQQRVMIDSVSVTVGNNESPLRPHVDTPPAKFKLSWPIANSDMTWNRWFEIVVSDPDVEINSLGGLAYNDIRQLREIGRRKVDSPALINASIPHDVWYESPGVFPRLGLQCKLLREPQEL